MGCRRRRLSSGSVLLVLAGTAATASAHDEDWRKLLDRLPPLFGEVYRAGDVNEDGVALNSTLGSLPTDNVTVLSHFPLNTMPGSPSVGNDCWGYTSPAGREYAIMGVVDGFVYVEVTDPANAQIVGKVAGPSSDWHDVKVIGEYAYGVSEGGAGIQVMDLRQIDNGVVTLVQNKMDGGHSTTHNIVANEESGWLYLVGSNLGNGGLIAVDVMTDPADPTIVGGWTDMYVHDAQVVTWTTGPYAGREIAFCCSGFGNGSTSTGLRIVDITNKTNPQTIGTLLYPAAAYSHQAWLSEDRQYLYLNDELDEQGGLVSTTTTRVIDVSDLTSPFAASTFTTGLSSIDHNLYTHNGFIFEANYRSGLRIFDSSNPTSPTEVAYVDTFPSNDNPSFNGAWSSYPYFESGTVILSDIESGLFVLDVDVLPAAPTRLVLIDSPPTLVSEGQEVVLTVKAYENPNDPLLGAPTLEFRFDDGAFLSLPLTQVDGETWEATVPAPVCGATPEFRISGATSGRGVMTIPSGGSNDYYSFEVGTNETLFTDNAENNSNGWVVGDPGDDATTGIWNRMDPEGTSAQPEDDHTDPLGSDCWVTDGRAGSGLGTYDIDSGRTTLYSPLLDMSGATDADISYWRWYSNDQGSSPNTDVFVVEISNNGSTWVNVETVGPAGVGTGGGWYENRFLVSDFVTPNSSVQLRFIAADEGDGGIIEAAIDDLSILRFGCAGTTTDCNGNLIDDASEIALGLASDANGNTIPDECDEPEPSDCPGDITTTGVGFGDPNYGVPDSVTDLADLLFFVNLWTSELGTTPNSPADLTTTGSASGQPSYGQPDGEVDLSDLLFYVNEWQVGISECP